MSLKLNVSTVILCALTLGTPAQAQAQNPFTSTAENHTSAAHVHGVAQLAVAVDGQSLVMELEVPLDSLVGFEHEPTTDAEKSAFADASRDLEQPSQLFNFNSEADCTLTSAQVDMPTFKQGAHQDVDARYQYDCRTPKELLALDVKLFATFGHIEVLEAIYINDDRQLATTLSHSDPTFSLR